MSHSEPPQIDADEEVRSQVPKPEAMPRAKRRQCGQIKGPCSRRAEASK